METNDSTNTGQTLVPEPSAELELVDTAVSDVPVVAPSQFAAVLDGLGQVPISEHSNLESVEPLSSFARHQLDSTGKIVFSLACETVVVCTWWLSSKVIKWISEFGLAEGQSQSSIASWFYSCSSFAIFLIAFCYIIRDVRNALSVAFPKSKAHGGQRNA